MIACTTLSIATPRVRKKKRPGTDSDDEPISSKQQRKPAKGESKKKGDDDDDDSDDDDSDDDDLIIMRPSAPSMAKRPAPASSPSGEGMPAKRAKTDENILPVRSGLTVATSPSTFPLPPTAITPKAMGTPTNAAKPPATPTSGAKPPTTPTSGTKSAASPTASSSKSSPVMVKDPERVKITQLLSKQLGQEKAEVLELAL